MPKPEQDEVIKFPQRTVCGEREGIWRCGKQLGHQGDHEGYNAFLRRPFSWPADQDKKSARNE